MNLLFLLVLLPLLGSCTRPPAASSAEVRYLGPGEPGTTHVQARGCSSRTGQDAVALQAATNAFETLFFRGIPGSDVATALVPDEASARRQYAAYWQEFYQQGRYRTFLVAQAEVSPRVQQCASYDLTINHAALRKDLEQHGVVRPFGY